MKCETISKYFSAVNAIHESRKEPLYHIHTTPIFHSEISFMETIQKNPDANAVELSKIINVTRGAITQWGNKLEEKGIVKRYQKEGNKKEKYYLLTEFGETILEKHAQHCDDANTKICQYLSNLDSKERAAIINFLETVSHLPISEFECNSNCCVG